MNFIKKFLLLFILFLCPMVVSAKVTSNISCTKQEVIAGNSFTCDVSVTPESGTSITSFKTAIDYPADFTLTKITPASNWTSNSNSIIDLTNSNYEQGQGLTTTLNIATLTFSVNSNVNYGTKEIKVRGYDLDEESSYTIKILSSNYYLKSLTVSGIDFSFSSKTYTYNLSTTKDSVTVSAIPMDTNSVFKSGYGPGTFPLNYGHNTIQIIVVAQNGSIGTYTLNIERIDQRSTNNNLKELKVSEGVLSPSFNKNNLTYNVSVSNDVKTLDIEATKEVDSSTYVEGYGPRTVEIQDGLNTFQIKVKSENGSTKTYTLNITKSEKSSNNFLKALKLKDVEINFDKNVYEYNANVLYNVLETEIIAVPEDIKAKVEVIGNKSLIIGENVFTINVIAENGAVLSYKITINRLEEGRTLSSNNYLSELLINNYPIGFNKDITNYTIKINNENRLTISYTPEDANSVVQIEGNNALKNGSKIIIRVTSEDKSVRLYTINIEKDQDAKTIFIYISIALVIVILLLLFLFRKKIFKPKQDQIISQDVNLKTSKLVLNNKKQNQEIFETKQEQVTIPEEDNK